MSLYLLVRAYEDRQRPGLEWGVSCSIAAGALAVLAKPKERRGRGAAKPPLKELGADPVSGKAMVVKEGRFGPYVTDGETNASLRKGDSVEQLTDERASELLAERRAKAPAPKKAAPKRAPAKKPAAKKPAAKRAPAKKAPVEK